MTILLLISKHFSKPVATTYYGVICKLDVKTVNIEEKIH